MARTKVQSELIATNAISGTIIADGAITSTHLAANCVDSSELVTGSIDTIHIAANQVTATKIVTNGVLTRHISDDQVTAAKLANSINTDIATGVTANTTANAALPKAGGTMTGALVVTGDANPALEVSRGSANTTNVNLKYNTTLTGQLSAANEKFEISAAGSGTEMEFYVNGAKRLEIDTSGHVGIGMTAAPVGSDTVLSIYNSATPRIKLHNNTTGSASGDGGEINMSGNIMILENRENAEMRFYTNGAERLQISNNGNLEFKSTTSSFTGASSFTNHTNGYLYLRGGTSGLRLDDDSSVNTIQIVDGSSGYIKFETGDGSERMRIDASGNVSIGQSFTSGANLHVEDTSDSMLLIYETGTSPYTATLKLASQSMSSYGSNVQYTSGAEQLTIENYGRALSAGSTSGGIRFRTKVGNGSLSEVMIINGHEGTITQPHQTFFMTNRSAGNQTFANAAWVDVDWTGEPYDTGGNYVLSSGVFTAPIAGVYLFTGLIGFNTLTATNYVLARMVCSSFGDFYITHEQKRDGGGDYGYDAAISTMVSLAASETVKIQVFAGSGGDHTLMSRSNWQGRLLG